MITTEKRHDRPFPNTTGGLLRYDGEVLALTPGEPGWLDAEAFALAARVALAGQDAAASRAALARYSGEFRILLAAGAPDAGHEIDQQGEQLREGGERHPHSLLCR